ncbi:Uncharacterized protein PBTT_10410 [Plasmodiophora brassicae]|uniref:Uncharacterized protein n=1 Tax=Plasmodiophora brassicae TaxID=37360 RepID=A0A0G4IX04_PLABS|nr:hypothetical protein PBRA_007612 [Plasmodiophora brassicae]SPR02032.1 unnamed protein product [Plasmodiophora brassicae]
MTADTAALSLLLVAGVIFGQAYATIECERPPTPIRRPLKSALKSPPSSAGRSARPYEQSPRFRVVHEDDGSVALTDGLIFAYPSDISCIDCTDKMVVRRVASVDAPELVVLGNGYPPRSLTRDHLPWQRFTDCTPSEMHSALEKHASEVMRAARLKVLASDAVRTFWGLIREEKALLLDINSAREQWLQRPDDDDCWLAYSTATFKFTDLRNRLYPVYETSRISDLPLPVTPRFRLQCKSAFVRIKTKHENIEAFWDEERRTRESALAPPSHVDRHPVVKFSDDVSVHEFDADEPVEEPPASESNGLLPEMLR